MSAAAATSGPVRVARGLTVAAVSGGLAVVAHAAAGGGLPSTSLTVVLTAVLAAIGVALADRRRGVTAIAGVVGASQLAMHTALDTLGHAHTTTVAPAADPVLMTALHAAAALVVAVVLAGGEAGVFALAAVLAWVRRALPRVPSPLVVAGAPATVVPDVVPVAGTDRARVRAHGRRGPPGVS